MIERLGRYNKTVSGQLTLLLPFIDKIRARVDLRERVVSFPPQPVITEDNLTLHIDTVVYFQVTNPQAAVYQISNYLVGVEQLTTTTLRNVVGGMTLEQTLTSRDQINGQLRGVLDEATGRGGCGWHGWSCAPSTRRHRSGVDGKADEGRSREAGHDPDRRGCPRVVDQAGRGPEAGPDPGGRGRQAGRDPGRRGRSAVADAEGKQERAASYLQAQGQAKAIEKTFAAIKAGRPTPSCSPISTCRRCR